jgi:hypothetical protein
MNDIESKLKQLLPSAGALDRDQLLYSTAFAAGKAAEAPKFPWRLVCGLLLCTQLGLIAWIARSPSAKVKLVVELPQTAPIIQLETMPPTSPPDPSSYWVLSHQFESDLRPKSDGNIPPVPPEVPLNAGFRNFE